MTCPDCSSDQWGPSKEGAGGWGVPKVVTPTSGGWLGEEDDTLSRQVEQVEWVDDEDWGDEEQTVYTDPGGFCIPKSIPGWLVVVLVWFLLGAAVHWAQPRPAQTSKSVPQTNDSLAKVLLEEARQKAAKGDFEVAASQALAAEEALAEVGGKKRERLTAGRLAAYYFQKAGRSDRALQVYESLIVLDPTVEGDIRTLKEGMADQQLTKAQDFLDWALAKLAEGRTNESIRAADRAKKLFRRHGGTPSQVGQAEGVLGMAYARSGDYGRAVTSLTRAIQACPKESMFRSELSWVRQRQAEEKAPPTAPAPPPDTSIPAPAYPQGSQNIRSQPKRPNRPPPNPVTAPQAPRKVTPPPAFKPPPKPAGPPRQDPWEKWNARVKK